MCWFWNHKWEDVKVEEFEATRTGYFDGWYDIKVRQLLIKQKCIKCGKYRYQKIGVEI